MSQHFGNTVYFIDIDDTLFHQDNGQIHVLDWNNKLVESISAEQFNTYQVKPGYHLDHSDFENSKLFKENAKPINCALEKLKTIINENKNLDYPDMIFILTARGDFDDKEALLDFFDKSGVPIRKYSFVNFIRTGNVSDKNFSVAQKKQAIVLSTLIMNIFKKFVMFDDSIKNLQAFYNTKKSCFKTDAEFDIVHVIHDTIDGKDCNYRCVEVKDKNVQKYIDIYKAKETLLKYGIEVNDHKISNVEVEKNNLKTNDKLDDKIEVKTTSSEENKK